jgi:hypothetical protein
VRLAEHRHVHRVPLLRWSRELGICGTQYDSTAPALFRYFCLHFHFLLRSRTSRGTAHVRPVPVYSAELAPPKLRGFFVGRNGMGVTFGYALASYMGLAFYYANSPAAQWRGPLGLALVFPAAMLLVILFVPESPRWLLMVARIDEARNIVMKLHHVEGDPDQ